MTEPNLKPTDFSAFFNALHGYDPFAWQQRLAERVCAGNWPDFIKHPTSSGKTACLDIAVFALACQAAEHHDAPEKISAPRRIFFVVDRRVIVNEAFQRATHICNQLETAVTDTASPLYPAAFWLRQLTRHESAPPLDCFELRGGIYRDDAWVRSMLQPTILTSTVDQFGSRVLFRGYGVSDRNLSIHAALTANDTLVILDEAHCSQPFSQTMDAVSRYRDARRKAGEEPNWSESSIRTPFAFTQMTATPDPSASADSIFELTTTDYQKDDLLKQRHACAKPIRLTESKAKGKRQSELLAKSLAKEAEALASPEGGQTPCVRVAVVVNRVASARHTYALLKEKHGDRVHLMIGRMRPLDRDELTEKLQATFRSDPDRDKDAQLSEPQFVVATQCLEVGADFDFDGMVSQCAGLDALRQRYGRLNRLGIAPHARGAIVMAAGDLKPKDADPIYGATLPNTWAWLQAHAVKDDEESKVIDFGVQAMESLVTTEAGDEQLTPESVNAPVLLPSHLDLLCQTAPRPAVEPDIATFLHGPDRGQVEVRVCWRADLPAIKGEARDSAKRGQTAKEAVAACPPTSVEVLSVPLAHFRHWLRSIDAEDESGDVLGEGSTDIESANSTEWTARCGVLWTGQSDRSPLISAATARSIRPNDTIVLPVTVGGWNAFGHLPDAPDEPTPGEDFDEDRQRELASIDIASTAFRQARNRTILRIHPTLVKNAADSAFFKSVKKWIDLDQATSAREVLSAQDEEPPGESPHAESTSDAEAARSEMAKHRGRLSEWCSADKRANRIQVVRYPDGLALIGPREPSNHESRRRLPRASFGDDFDEANVDGEERLLLANHLADVADETERLLNAVPPMSEVAEALVEAARLHDVGKADGRFQAMLLGATPDVAGMQPALLAKSGSGISTRQASGQQISHSLPRGFRHEMLSVELAKKVATDLNDEQQDLMLHAIAAHHGHARPFAPVVADNDPPAVSLKKLDGVSDVELTAEERTTNPPAHRLDSGIAERFWQLNRRFGWWGLAWLESAVRLSDWTASAQPRQAPGKVSLTATASTLAKQPAHELALPGIDGANPLGFLTALGLLRAASATHPGTRMSWQPNGTWIPVLWFTEEISESDFVDSLHSQLTGRATEFHFTKLGRNITVPQTEFHCALLTARGDSCQSQRTTVDFLAAFGTDALVSENDETIIQDTALRTMAGAGHQHFLETMRNVIEACTADHLRKTLFEIWRYDDPTQTLSLRFDPLDDNRYALRWRNPSGDPDRRKSGSVLGANRLSIEAIPFFTTAPGRRFVQTVGFRGHRSRDTFFRWPIWSVPIDVRVAASLLAAHTVQEDDKRDHTAIGVSEIFSSQRITVGKVRNFTPSKAVGHPASM